MGDLVYTELGSGLVIASEGADEAACRAALKQHDPDLCLVPQDSDAYGTRIYKVYRRVNAERSEFVCFWGNEETLEPYPLSVTGLLEMVKRQDRNLRGGDRSTLAEREAKLLAERRRDYDREREALLDEFRDRLSGKKFTPQPRGRSLQTARMRERHKRPNLPKDLQP